jgi:lipid-A-disaccharide synthase
MGEVRRLSHSFLEAAHWVLERRPGLRFVLPCASRRIRAQIETELGRIPRLPLTLTDGQARDAMAASDLVLTASGTATLEALLVKRPMVVAYRLQSLTYWVVRLLRLVKVPHVAMANLLAGRELAPELLQGAATPEALGRALLDFLDHPARMTEVRDIYAEIHRRLRQDSDQRAAEAVIELMRRRGRDV